MKNKLLYIFTAFFFSANIVLAQELDAISKLNVESYTDEQISTYWEKAQQQGYSLDQLELITSSKGMSRAQFAKLKERILNLNTFKQKNEALNDTEEEERSDLEVFALDGNQDAEMLEKNKLFGFDFFNNPNISFTPNLNLATPTTYQLGPGDELMIDLWGASENTYRKKISREGAIRIEGIGPIYVSGLSVGKAKAKIVSYLKKIYNGIGAANNSVNKVYSDISLVGVRTVQISIIGEVKTPGSYSLSALSNVLNALYAAGGPSENGTFRNVKVIRNGQELVLFDIYEFLKKGADKGNVLLQDQDVVLVSSYIGKIEVEGEVKRPGVYELRKGESLQDLVNYFSGFSSNAYTERLFIERVNGKEKEFFEVLFSEMNTFQMQDGDRLNVGEIVDRYTNQVSIEGAIYRPGNYELNKGLTLFQLLEKAAGVKENAFLERGIVYRNKNEFEQEIISFSLVDILSKKASVLLEKEDSVFIFDKTSLKEAYTITINGAINKPQTIPFIDKITVEDLIAMSEGFKDGADTSVIDISRKLKDGNFETISEVIQHSSDIQLTHKKQVYLRPFDIVSVRYIKGYTKQQKVTVRGEVAYPGEYLLIKKNERISDLVERVGGFSPHAYLEGATIFRKRKEILEEKKNDLFETLQKKDSLLDLNVASSTFQIPIDMVEIMKNGSKVSKYDIFLREGDELFIPSEKQTVEVQGEILSPSLVPFESFKSVREYLNSSGGLTGNAKKSSIYVVYANGRIKSTKSFMFFHFYPKIEPGAVILVPRKEETRKLSTQEILGITTSLGTLGIIINTLTN